MFADHLRSAIEAAPRITLPVITAQLWRAFGEGQVSETEAEALAGLIEAKRATVARSPVHAGASAADALQDRAGGLRTGVGSRPRTDASMERRRRWAASGRLPPALAARFTLAEQAVLSLVAAETVRRKDCRLAIDHMAALAGISRSTVKNAVREAVRLGLVTVEERRLTGFRNDTNIVRIVAPEWLSWIRLTRKRPRDEALASTEAFHHHPTEGGGVKTSTGTPTSLQLRGKQRPADPSRGLPKGSGRPDRKRSVGNRGGR